MAIQTNSKKQTDSKDGQPGGSLGTFAGVFTPSILTILGIILFLRLGYVTGSSGLAKALLILAVANLVTIITSQSLAAIATNLKVKGGGDYYLISRTLGYKFGGSIGIVLYLAQSVSVAFYCIGFAEAVSVMLGTDIHPGIIAALAVSALFVLAWLGADWATKFQYVVMLLLVAALASFYLGGFEKWQQSQFLANWQQPGGSPPFWIIFAVFFPAVTGFTQGVSMSGDLKDPGKSLPAGTFLAVGVSIIVYLSVMLLFAGALPNSVMMEDYQAMQNVARWGFLIDAGVVAATLSSAMASFMGGPRILQSLAADKIFPVLNIFAHGSGASNNPRRGTLLTAAIAFATISLGQLNLVAQVVSMFFLISYGLLNYATYYEADTGSASFRPRFKYFNKYVSLFGGLLCLGILLALDMENGIVALVIMFAIFLYLKRSARPARWADSSRSHSFSRIRKHLMKMTEVAEHQRDWYPHLLAFTKDRENREKLLCFGDWLCGDTGLMSAVQVVPAHDSRGLMIKSQVEKELQEDISANNLFCYPKAICAEDFSSSIPLILQSYGFGPLHGNTILANWFNQSDSQLPGLERMRYGHNLRTAYRQGFNLIVFHCEKSRWEGLVKPDGKREKIDIWWHGEDRSRKLMLMFAYLVARDKLWEKAEIRVLSPEDGAGFGEARISLLQLFDEARIPAEAIVVEDMEPDTILHYSRGSGLVFLPFKITNSRLRDIAGYSLERVLPQLNATAMVKAAEEIDLDAEPEEGSAGELAQAMDELYEAEKHLKRVQSQEKKAADAVEKLSEQIRLEGEKLGEEMTSERLQELQKALFETEKLKEKLYRKTIKATAKRDEKIGHVHELGGITEETITPQS